MGGEQVRGVVDGVVRHEFERGESDMPAVPREPRRTLCGVAKPHPVANPLTRVLASRETSASPTHDS